MPYYYRIPDWFFGFDIGMEVLFAVVTLLVAAYSFRISKVTKEREVTLFGIGFLLIGISYIILASINYWFVRAASDGFREVRIDAIQILGNMGIYSYIILFICGLVTLTYITAGMKKGKTYYLLFGLSLLVIFFSMNKLITFRILSVFLLSFIAFRYLRDYAKNKNRKEFCTMIAFVLLLLSNIDFIFSHSHYQAYVFGRLLELSAYLMILFILIRSVKK